ncbi:tRNA lysidine(34) synthetase TilS [Lacicoccus alkaliphilus]|uniref:tRNA(Ile)-lysidine synthase n=1 Tax=Lacicoccus alkaliphilus DSM 16010 TaxID=1123231 RepID=A0A1M7K3Y7_9BACL|nr:tRNA lysidine(34) synthetase TilS [Salinicoccus alkaliphilus]SHM59968.1 tRNA(Ile)-lysidine synthase [Salinicoccus alkaliphilus DSM 16010]
MAGKNEKLMHVTWAPSDMIALAVSGGIDSMVLYHMLRTGYSHTFDKLILLHVNHGLRPEAADEEKYIKDLGARHGHTVEVKHLSMAADFSQAKARALRYHFFKTECLAHGAAVLLTAHHRDDHHETILHQLLTGRHLNAALGIKRAGMVEGLPVARPLAGLSRAMIDDYQEKQHVHYFEDETNAGDDYTRNYIRHHLMPVIRNSPHLHEGSLDRVAEDMDELKALARTRAGEFINRSEGMVLGRGALNDEPHVIQVFIVQQWLDLHGVQPGRKFIEELLGVIHSDTPQSDLYIGDKVIKVRYDELFVDNVDEKHVKSMDEGFLISQNGSYRFNDHRIEVDLPVEMLPLTVRSRAEGDVMRLKHTGRKKLSRIFIDNKVPREDREQIPVIVDEDNEIIALGTIYNIIETRENYNGLIISKEKTHEFEE